VTGKERGKARIEGAAERVSEARSNAGERATEARAAISEKREVALEKMGERRDAAAEKMGERREAAVERMGEAREVAVEAVETARAAAVETVATAKAAAADQIAKVKPRLRGVSHEYAFFVSLLLGITLIVLAKGGEARLAVAIYAASVSALFGVSALYHRHDWKSSAARRWMRRLDHTMIFFLIAGTVTPFALLLMSGPFATALLIAVWAGAIAGSVIELVWTDSPKWASSIVYAVVGLIGAIGFPAIAIEGGWVAGVLIAGGGLLYLGGAVVYATEKPNPNPAVFGYHEIFHVMVIAAAAAHFAAVAFFALPAA
jgi:hemolysin III